MKRSRKRCFEPYFTTKENSTNLGIDLYLVDKVIREHSGFLELDSEKDKGTRFSIYLPLPTKIAEPETAKKKSRQTMV